MSKDKDISDDTTGTMANKSTTPTPENPGVPLNSQVAPPGSAAAGDPKSKPETPAK